jgi:signal transduction histidine kinase
MAKWLVFVFLDSADAPTSSSCAHMRRLIDDVLSLSKLGELFFRSFSRSQRINRTLNNIVLADGDLLQICPQLCQPVQFIREVLLTFRAEFAVEGIQCNLALGQGYETLGITEAILDPARTQQIVSRMQSRTQLPTLLY